MVELSPQAGSGAKTSGEVRSIQYLRGFAAFGVLVFHAAERAGGAFGLGAAGVDVFFVISGFIMWVVTAGRPVSPGAFLVRRVQRIAPLYWGLTLGVAAIALVSPAVFPAMQPTFGHVLKSLLFVPHRDSTGLIAPLVVPGWTLNYEMFFYLLFAAGLLAPARWRAELVSVALVGLVAIRPLGDTADPLWATYTNPLLLEFCAGLWLGRAWTAGRLPGPRTAWVLVTAGLLGFAASGFSGVDVERARFVFWGIPAALMVAGAVSLERCGAVPDCPPLRVLGDASYSLYLVHGLAISAVARLLQAAGLQHPALLFAGAIGAGVAAGLLAYRFLERPLVKLFKTRRRSPRPPPSPRVGSGAAGAPAEAP